MASRASSGVRSFQSSVRINVGPNKENEDGNSEFNSFQSSVRINVGPNISAPP